MTRPRPTDPSIASQTPPAVHRLMAELLSDDAVNSASGEIARRGWWEYMAAESCDAGLGGILLDRLNALHIDLPASAIRQMSAYREHVIAANAYKLAEVSRVLARLQMAKVPFLLLKGAALNAVLYQPGQRPMTDVDVLIHPADADLADRILANAGCRPGADLVREDFYPRFYCEREYFTHRVPPVKIDLHCRPFHLLRYARTVPENALWRNAREVALGDLNVLIPGPEEMLIHLAVHAACHGNAQLRWLYDVQLWIDQFGHEIDVEHLADTCRHWRVALPVNRTLRRVKEAFGVSEPTSLKPATHARDVCRDYQHIGFTEPGSDCPSLLDRMIRATTMFAGPLDRLALAGSNLYQTAPALHVACNAVTTPGIRFRLGYLAATLLPGPGHLAQIYPRRHPGWQLAAHAVRGVRMIRATLTGTE